MVETPTVNEVEAQYGPTDIETDAPDGETSKAEQLIEAAERMAQDLYGDAILFTSEQQGNAKDFVILLACHKWALREGEPQSESQAGGSVTYNTVTGEVQDSLSQTKWGREALGYLGDQPNISVFKT